MSHELFYTSAPKGLEPGSQGYCTVAATRGLSAPLREKLEALSVYRAVYPPHDPKAGLNPVACSHVRLSVAGRSYHVLSRVCAAGLDYSDRTNKFAHHLVLEPGELPEGGPAWLLAQPGVMEEAWDGEARYLPPGRRLPDGNAPGGVCRAWRDATGDAGWAGVVAEALTEDPHRLVYLVYQPGTDILPLLQEAFALLPPARRWEVTFSSYFTGMPGDVRCSCRGVLHDSPEARDATRLPGALVLDLTAGLGTADGDGLVAQARTGRASQPARRPAMAPAPRVVPVRHSSRPDGDGADAWPERPAVAPPRWSAPAAQDREEEPAAPPPRPPAATPPPGGWPRLPIFILGAVTGAMIAAAAAAGVWVLGGQHAAPPATAPSGDGALEAANTQQGWRIDKLEKERDAAKKELKEIKGDLAQKDNELNAARDKLRNAQEQLDDARNQLRAAQGQRFPQDQMPPRAPSPAKAAQEGAAGSGASRAPAPPPLPPEPPREAKGNQGKPPADPGKSAAEREKEAKEKLQDAELDRVLAKRNHDANNQTEARRRARMAIAACKAITDGLTDKGTPTYRDATRLAQEMEDLLKMLDRQQ